MNSIELVDTNKPSILPQNKAEKVDALYKNALDEERAYGSLDDPLNVQDFGTAFENMHNIVRWAVGEEPTFDAAWFTGSHIFDGLDNACFVLPRSTSMMLPWGVHDQRVVMLDLYEEELEVNLNNPIVEKIYRAEPLLQMLDEHRARQKHLNEQETDRAALVLKHQAIRADIRTIYGVDPLQVAPYNPARRAYNRNLTWLESNPPQKELPVSIDMQEDALVNALLDKYTRGPVAVCRNGELFRVDETEVVLNVVQRHEWLDPDELSDDPIIGPVLEAVMYAVDPGYNAGKTFARHSLSIRDEEEFAKLIDAKLLLENDASRAEIIRLLLDRHIGSGYSSSSASAYAISEAILKGWSSSTVKKQANSADEHVMVGKHDGVGLLNGRVLLSQSVVEVDFNEVPVTQDDENDTITIKFRGPTDMSGKKYSVPGFRAHSVEPRVYLSPAENDPYELPNHQVSSEQVAKVAKLLRIGGLAIAGEALHDYTQDGNPLRLDRLVEIMQLGTVYDDTVGWYGAPDGFDLEKASQYGVVEKGMLRGDCKISAASLRTILGMCGMLELRTIIGYSLDSSRVSLPGHAQVAFKVPGYESLYVADSTASDLTAAKKQEKLQKLLQVKPASNEQTHNDSTPSENVIKNIEMLCDGAANELLDVAHVLRPLQKLPSRDSKLQSLLKLPDEHILRKAFVLLTPYDIENKPAGFMPAQLEAFIETYTQLLRVMNDGNLTPTQTHAFEILTSGNNGVLKSVLKTLNETYLKLLKI